MGDKDGKNETFYSEYNYIAGSEKLNINGSIYYPNSGFFKEGNNIILSGAPIPEAGDFMFLEGDLFGLRKDYYIIMIYGD